MEMLEISEKKGCLKGRAWISEASCSRCLIPVGLQHLKRVRPLGLGHARRALDLLLGPVLHRDGREPVLVSLRPRRLGNLTIDLLLRGLQLRASVRLRLGSRGDLVLGGLAVAVHLDHGALDLAADALQRV